MIARALGLEEVNESTMSFKDSNKIKDWARGYVNAIYELGYIKGYENGDFKPQNNLKRAEAVTILVKVQAEIAD